MSDNEFGDQVAKQLSQGIAKNRSLRKLNLCGNQFTMKSAPEFLRAVRRNNYILQLNLHENALDITILN